jgi:hypothetical protein
VSTGTLAPTVAELDAEIKVVKKALRRAGAPSKLIAGTATRALKTGRKLTGAWKTNRDPRWSVDPLHPQYGTEVDCKLILLRLFATLLEFDGAPQVEGEALDILERRLGRKLVPNSFRDELLLEKLPWADVVADAEDPRHGFSPIHIGHRDPTHHPRHTPDNVEWRTERSNLIQGNLTLPEARMYLVQLIARYFELGEIQVVPDPTGDD